MKDLSFISNTNGLVVTAPADAFPSPNCGKVMCPIRVAEEVVEPFACSPQLDPGEGSVTFSVVAEVFTPGGEDPLDVTGAIYDGSGEGGWTAGDGPDGAPVGIDEFNIGSDAVAFTVFYSDASPYSAITVSVFNSEGDPLVVDGEMVIDGTGALLTLSDEDYPVLEDGETYCVVFTFTPVEEE